MKTIFLPVRSPWACKILNKLKIVEVRTRFPKDFRGWVYLYCTKAKPYLLDFGDCEYPYKNGGYELSNIIDDNIISHGADILNGKVIARFWVDDVERLFNAKYFGFNDEFLDSACLTQCQLDKYVGENKRFYAIHIAKLEIFDASKTLADFGLTRAPQSWCYVEER